MTEKYLLTKNENTVTILKKDTGWNYKKEFGSIIIENFDISNDKLDEMLLELKNFGYNITAQPKTIKFRDLKKSLESYYNKLKFLRQYEYKFYYRQDYSATIIQSILRKYCMSYAIKEGTIEAHVKTDDKKQVLLKQLKPNLPIGILLEIHVHEEQ